MARSTAPDGSRPSETLGRRDEMPRIKAESACARIQQELNAGNRAVGYVPTLGEWFDAFEARKFSGPHDEHRNSTPHDQIELYCGRAGKRLLTLADCMTARAALRRAGL